MGKIVVIYGLISGAILTAFLWLMTYLWAKGTLTFDNGEYSGYGSMLVSLSMVFFGIKSYRDNQSKKSIGFWKGVQIGLLISLIASVCYATGWEVYLQANPEIKSSFFQK